MHTCEDHQFVANQDALRRYAQHVGGGRSPADELAKLAALRDQGVLTADEFAAQKTKIVA